MATDWGSVGNILTGAGMGLDGRGGDFQRNLMGQREQSERSEDRKRQMELQRMQTVYTDSAAALNLAKQGRFDLVTRLGQERLAASKSFPEADFSDTERLTYMASKAADGDRDAAQDLVDQLQNNVRIGESIGILKPAEGPKIHSVKGGQAIVQDGDQIRAQGIEGYDPSLAGPGDARGQFAGNESYVDEAGNYFVATRVADPSTRQTHVALAPVGHNEQQQGAVRPVNSLGLTADQVPGQKRAESEATGQGSGMAERAKETLQLGVDAARSMPIVNRSIELLDMVETGGIDAAALKFKQWTGLTSGDEAELTNNLGKAVLSQLRSTFGAQFTEREGRTLQEMEANLGKSTQGNKRILRQLAKMNKQKVDQAMKAAASMGDYRTAAEMQDYMELNMGDEQMTEVFGGAPAASNSEIPAAPGAQQQPPQPGGGIRFLGFEGG